jgi:tRNA nucleotidyltransferase (CCA-adding enzyme)
MITTAAPTITTMTATATSSLRRQPGVSIAMMLARREDGAVEIPPAPVLLERISQLPAGRPLLDRLQGRSGVYLVGGAVRDLLLGGSPRELDLLVEGDVAEVAGLLGGRRVVHDRFGTSTVKAFGHAYDLARSRSETYPRPGALPDVQPAPLREDLKRRDFTVNAIAAALGGQRAGELIHAPKALEDLDGRLLRALHEASFRDDPTRMIRLVRYQSRLRFEVEPGTRRLCVQAIADGALETVTRPRIGNELRLLARERDPVLALEQARDLELDQAIQPRFGLRDSDLARSALALLPDEARRDRLVLAAASLSIEPAELARALDAMAFKRSDRDVIVAAATRPRDVADALTRADRPSEIAEAVAGAPAELVALAGAFGPAAAAGEWLERLRGIKLEIDGDDLVAAGVAEGPAVGRGLRAALAAKLDGAVEDREAELAEALKAARQRG